MKFVAFSLLLLSTFCVTASPAQIRLNEILADPASDWDGDGEVNSRSDEWIEIINTGAASEDLSNYRLGDLSGGDNWRYAFTGSLGPEEIAVFYGSQVIQWQRDNGVSTYGLSLNNAGDTVFLYRVTVSDTVVVDQYAYSSHEVQDDRSVGRNPDGAASWVIFDALNPYNGSEPPLGSGCSPSPGQETSCATPVEKTTWGAVKKFYLN